MKWGFRIILLLTIQAGCLSLSYKACAQEVTTSTNIFIPDGLLVTLDGSLSNSGFILNNGIITLTGDWLNTAVYQGLGSVTLNGSDQQINNNRQSFNSLFIDGGGLKILAGSITVDRLLTFTEGILKISDEDTLRLLPAAVIEGGSTLSYVDGAMITNGTGYKFFPVGKNGKYHPVELLDVTGINPGIEIEVQENLPVIQTSVPSTPVSDIYWTRKIIRGTYEGSPITVQYNVRAGIDPAQLVMLEGEHLEKEFTTRETTLEQTNDLDIIESQNTSSGNIIALAELVGDPPRQYYFSTTLSPHASNPENRYVKIFGDAVTDRDFRFQVFNRWGLVVFESSSATHMTSAGWDGRQNGNLLPSGAYPYSLTYVDTSGKAIKRTGFITIIQ